MADNTYFSVQICKGDPDKLASWWEEGTYSELWVAKSRAKTLLENRSDLAGKVRIVRCIPLHPMILER